MCVCVRVSVCPGISLTISLPMCGEGQAGRRSDKDHMDRSQTGCQQSQLAFSAYKAFAAHESTIETAFL